MNTYWGILSCIRIMKYPHIRGEHELSSRGFVGTQGSPPLTRGTQNSIFRIIKTIRITPAYAGNTHLRMSALQHHRDHPRIRGEHKSAFDLRVVYPGSPPHTRGTQFDKAILMDWEGITPAYAGNTSPYWHAKALFRDHPCIRGEHGALEILKPI